MKLAVYTDCVSPHQFPLACELATLLGDANFRNIYHHPLHPSRVALGWSPKLTQSWEILTTADKESAQKVLENVRVLMSSVRDVDLFKRRSNRGLTTIYYGERFFKPNLGMARLLRPSYFKKAKQIANLLGASENFYYYPIGIHAARDMARLCGMMSGDFRCLFRAPKLEFEKRPGGRIFIRAERVDCVRQEKGCCLDKMRMWGYLVAPSESNTLSVGNSDATKTNETKVLWVGRLLKLKRVDTIVRAVSEYLNLKQVDDSLPKITLDIYGNGPEKQRLAEMSAGCGGVVEFHEPVSIGEVRRLMREHDVYVMSSDAHEGWGAVVSEALEEGMKVVGTYESGSCATILPETNLFHAGDWRRLASLLSRPIPKVDGSAWSAKAMARCLLNQVEECLQ